MSLIERLNELAERGLPHDVRELGPEAATQLEAMQAEIDRLREELRLWLILVNEGGVPRYTVQPGAALNTVVTSTKRLVARASLDRQGK